MPLLERVGRMATRWPGGAPGSPARHVVCYADGSIAAVCRAGLSPRLNLDAQDVELWAPNWSDVRKAVSAALQLHTSTTPSCCPDRVLRIGHWEPKPQTAYPVLLVAGSSVSQFIDLVHRAVSSASHPPIVLSMTRDSWTDELQEWVATRKALLVALAEVVEIDESGMWVATRAWAETLTAFSQKAGFNPKARTQNTRKPARNHQRLSDIDLVRTRVRELAFAQLEAVAIERSRGATAELKRYKQNDLVKELDLSDSRVSRALLDKRSKETKRAFKALGNAEAIWEWGEEEFRRGRFRDSPTSLRTIRHAIESRKSLPIRDLS